MAIISGYGELVFLNSNQDAIDVCAGEFNLVHSFDRKKFSYFNSSRQLLVTSDIQPIVSKQWVLNISAQQFERKLLELFMGNPSLELQAINNLRFTGSIFSTQNNKPTIVSSDSLTPIQVSPLASGAPLNITFNLNSPPTFYSTT